MIKTASDINADSAEKRRLGMENSGVAPVKPVKSAIPQRTLSQSRSDEKKKLTQPGSNGMPRPSRGYFSGETKDIEKRYGQASASLPVVPEVPKWNESKERSAARKQAREGIVIPAAPVPVPHVNSQTYGGPRPTYDKKVTTAEYRRKNPFDAKGAQEKGIMQFLSDTMGYGGMPRDEAERRMYDDYQREYMWRTDRKLYDRTYSDMGKWADLHGGKNHAYAKAFARGAVQGIGSVLAPGVESMATRLDDADIANRRNEYGQGVHYLNSDLNSMEKQAGNTERSAQRDEYDARMKESVAKQNSGIESLNKAKKELFNLRIAGRNREIDKANAEAMESYRKAVADIRNQEKARAEAIFSANSADYRRLKRQSDIAEGIRKKYNVFEKDYQDFTGKAKAVDDYIKRWNKTGVGNEDEFARLRFDYDVARQRCIDGSNGIRNDSELLEKLTGKQEG